MAAPSPTYPADAPIDGEWLGGCVNGCTVIMQMMRLPGHRSDQWAAWIDGELVTDAAGLTLLWAAIKARWPKAPSLQQLATMHEQYSARDEADAAAAHMAN
jgi:hypothetical protein